MAGCKYLVFKLHGQVKLCKLQVIMVKQLIMQVLMAKVLVTKMFITKIIS